MVASHLTALPTSGFGFGRMRGVADRVCVPGVTWLKKTFRKKVQGNLVMFPVSRASLHLVNTIVSLWNCCMSCDRTEPGWAQPDLSTWGGQRKENSQDREKGLISVSCPSGKTNSRVSLLAVLCTALGCAGKNSPFTYRFAGMWKYIPPHSFLIHFLSSCLLPFTLWDEQTDQDFQSWTTERISMERYHESTYSTADLVWSCLSHGPG